MQIRDTVLCAKVLIQVLNWTRPQLRCRVAYDIMQIFKDHGADPLDGVVDLVPDMYRKELLIALASVYAEES